MSVDLNRALDHLQRTGRAAGDAHVHVDTDANRTAAMITIREGDDVEPVRYFVDDHDRLYRVPKGSNDTRTFLRWFPDAEMRLPLLLLDEAGRPPT